jgi:hypothetical protein
VAVELQQQQQRAGGGFDGVRSQGHVVGLPPINSTWWNDAE